MQELSPVLAEPMLAVCFNNDVGGHAVHNARTLRTAVEKVSALPSQEKQELD